MAFHSFLQWLHDTGFSAFLRESIWAEPIVESIHVLTLTLFLGFTFLLDLRLLGVCLCRWRVSEVRGQFNSWAGTGFAVMTVTGLLLFIADPIAFYGDTFFRVKMLLLALAILNGVVFNRTVGRNVIAWDENPRTPGGAKVAAILSLVLWVAIVAAGRAIAYTLPPP
jgi:hypothetical protein